MMTKPKPRKTMLVSSAIALATATPSWAQAPVASPAASKRETDEIVVTADRPDSFGADFVQAGSFRGARQIDTPLTVTVLPEKLLRSQQANGLADALRNSAGVVASQITPAVYSNLTIRGITVENRGNYRLNGTLPIINLIDLPLENKFRVEALKGASSLYYGFTTPGGIINLTSKRPTQVLSGGARLAFNQYGQAVASVEVGDTIGTIGYRLTAAGGTQEFGIRKVEGRRYFLAGAFDWKPLDGLTVQIDAEQIYKSVSEPTAVQLSTAAASLPTVLPALLDPRVNLGDKWLQSESEEHNLLLHARYDATSWLSFTGDIGQSWLTRNRRFSTFQACTPGLALCNTTLYPGSNAVGYAFQPGDGVVTVTQSNRLFYRNRMARAEAEIRFNIGSIKNSLILGYSRNARILEVPVTANPAGSNCATAQGIGSPCFRQNSINPVNLAYNPFPARVLASASDIDDKGYYASDTLKFGEIVTLIGGIRKTDYKEHNRFTQTISFATKPTTYAASAVVKPARWASVYASYIEGLETTALAPANAANPFASLPASPSTQYEAGVKIEPIRNFLITAAYFRINRTQAGLNPTNNIYQFIGKARFEGVEFSASGEVTPDLSVYLSALALTPRQLNSPTATLVGKLIENTPRTTASAFVEYRLPMLPGLALSAGAYHTGARAVNALNTVFVPSYTLFDLGGSYTTTLGRNKVTFRVNAENVGGKRYFAATGTSLLGQGLPANIKFAIETTF